MTRTFEPREFLNSIACLDEHGEDTEDVRRTIAGRAYYAVYGTFKLQMGNLNVHHAALRDALAERSEAPAEKKKWQDIRDKMGYLWKLRRESDYDYVGITLEEWRIKIAVEYAHELIGEIREIAPATMTNLYRRMIELKKARDSSADQVDGNG